MTQTQEHNVPALRFPEFSGEWTISKIQDLIDMKMIIGHLDGNHGELYPRSEEFSSEGVPYIAANDFYKGSIDFSFCKKLPEVRAKKFKKGIAKNGDVLFAHNATVGPTTVLETDLDFVILSTTATYFRCDLGKLSNWFLKAFFESEKFVRQCHRVKFQSTRSQVPITAQRKFYIGLPTLPEQQKIAAFLSSVDRRIAQLGQKKALLQRYKKGMMQKLFSQELRFKDAQGHDFPDWEEKRLGEIFERVTRKNKENNTNVLTISAQMGLTNQMNYFNHSVSAKDVTGYYLLERGDFAYNKSYSKGYPMGAIKRLKAYDKGVVSTLYICFRAKNPESQFFFEKLFDAGYQNRWIHKIAQEGARNHGLLNMAVGDFFGIPLPLPSRPEQQKIADFLSSIDRKIDLVSTELAHAKAFKKGLLQQMFI